MGGTLWTRVPSGACPQPWVSVPSLTVKCCSCLRVPPFSPKMPCGRRADFWGGSLCNLSLSPASALRGWLWASLLEMASWLLCLFLPLNSAPPPPILLCLLVETISPQLPIAEGHRWAKITVHTVPPAASGLGQTSLLPAGLCTCPRLRVRREVRGFGGAALLLALSLPHRRVCFVCLSAP